MNTQKYAVPLSLFVLFSMGIYKADCKRIRKTGEFLAGTFILTQKSLSEAPYRYAGVLRKALDKAETKDPPSKADEENCDVRYRILPSGTTSLQIKSIISKLIIIISFIYVLGFFAA